MERDRRALGRKGGAEGGTDATAGTGDEDDPIAKPKVHQQPPSGARGSPLEVGEEFSPRLVA